MKISCKNTFGVKNVAKKWMHEEIGNNKIWYQNVAKA